MTFAQPRHRLLAPVFGFLLLFGVAGCDPAMDTRTALIIQTLVDADRDLVVTRPTLVAEKYQVMAQGLQPYLRGTALIFYRDLSRYQDSQASILHGTGTEQEPYHRSQAVGDELLQIRSSTRSRRSSHQPYCRGHSANPCPSRPSARAAWTARSTGFAGIRVGPAQAAVLTILEPILRRTPASRCWGRCGSACLPPAPACYPRAPAHAPTQRRQAGRSGG